MSQRSIRIRGARTNNLKSLDVDVPRGQVVVFVGLSGSGTSSLVFDTIAAEAGYQLNETFPPFTRNRLPKWTRPEVGQIDGLSPVVVIDQRRSRMSVSRVTSPSTIPPACAPTCSGLGERVISAVDRFLDLDRSLRDGAILLPGFGNEGYWYSQYADVGSFDADTPLRPDLYPGLRRPASTPACVAAPLPRPAPVSTSTPAYAVSTFTPA